MTAVPWFPGVSLTKTWASEMITSSHSFSPTSLGGVTLRSWLTASEFSRVSLEAFLSGIFAQWWQAADFFNHRAFGGDTRSQFHFDFGWLFLEKIRKPFMHVWHFTDDNTFTNILSFDFVTIMCEQQIRSWGWERKRLTSGPKFYKTPEPKSSDSRFLAIIFKAIVGINLFF